MQQTPPYVVRRNRRARSVRLTISHEGKLIVTAPPFLPGVFIRNTINTSEVWIRRHMAAHERAKKRMKNANAIFYKGKEHVIRVSMGPSEDRVVLRDGIMHVHPVQDTEASVKKQITRWYKSRAEEHMAHRAHILSARMKTPFAKIEFRNQKTRWGSCSSRKTLSFNWKLMQAPEDVIDYVIIHELSHITHMNHSRAFWNHVASFDPSYKEHRVWLRKNAILLHSTILS